MSSGRILLHMNARNYNVSRMNTDRLAAGWTYSKLAQKMKVHPSTVSRFLRGQLQHPATAMRMAKALGHPLSRYVPERRAS